MEGLLLCACDVCHRYRADIVPASVLLQSHADWHAAARHDLRFRLQQGQ